MNIKIGHVKLVWTGQTQVDSLGNTHEPITQTGLEVDAQTQVSHNVSTNSLTAGLIGGGRDITAVGSRDDDSLIQSGVFGSGSDSGQGGSTDGHLGREGKAAVLQLGVDEVLVAEIKDGEALQTLC